MGAPLRVCVPSSSGRISRRSRIIEFLKEPQCDFSEFLPAAAVLLCSGKPSLDWPALPVSRGRQAWQVRRIAAALGSRHGGCAGVLPKGRGYKSLDATKGESRRECREPSRFAVAWPRRPQTEISRGSLLPLSQQHCRTGPPRDQTPLRLDVGPEVIQYRGHYICRRRAGKSNSQGTIFIWPRRTKQ